MAKAGQKKKKKHTHTHSYPLLCISPIQMLFKKYAFFEKKKRWK